MTKEKKVLYKQAQIAGLGLVISIIGFIYQRMDVIGIGIAFFVYGLARTYFIWKILKRAEED